VESRECEKYVLLHPVTYHLFPPLSTLHSHTSYNGGGRSRVQNLAAAAA